MCSPSRWVSFSIQRKMDLKTGWSRSSQMPTQHSWKQGLWIPRDIINLILNTRKQLSEVKWLAVSHVWGRGDVNSRVISSKCIFLSIALSQTDWRSKTNAMHQRVWNREPEWQEVGAAAVLVAAGGNVQWDPYCAKSFSIIWPKHMHTLCTLPFHCP